MSRRNTKPTGGVQMFSFLDAMICTMGALLVLLHAFARHGHTEAVRTVETRNAERAAAERSEIEEIEWRIAQVKQSRSKTEAQLADERLKLSHVEDHQRRLREKLAQLKAAVAQMEKSAASEDQDAEQHQAELAELKQQLETARLAVDEARKNGKTQGVNYSVVPYLGPNSTRRRPIYIECRDNCIVLQPEGVELSPQDFVGFFGPGNPLASALRAQREYLASQSANGTLPDEPYPLLLVRPEGIAAYYAARSALDSWGGDFGYELVGSDWELSFPPADARLAAITRDVVDNARSRTREYVMSSPQVAKSRPKPKYHARSSGGFAREGTYTARDGAGVRAGGWDDFAGDWAKGTGGSASTRPSSNPGGGTVNGLQSGLADNTGRGRDLIGETRDSLSGTGTARNTPGSAATRTDRYGNPIDPNALGGPATGDAGSGDPANERLLGDSQFARNPYSPNPSVRGGKSTPGAKPGSGAPGTGTSGEGDPRETRPAANDGKSFAHTAGGNPGASGSGESVNKDSGDTSSGAGPSAPGAQKLGGTPDTDPGGAPSQSIVGSPSSPSMSPARKSRPQSLATTRGADWGLPNAGVHAVAAERPVVVECHPDRLVVVSEDPRIPSKQIPLGEDTSKSMDDLVNGVWDHMKTWGKAGKGMYWRPTLSLDVKPGAADRYSDIKALLADSGLGVHERRARSRAAVQPTPSRLLRK